MRGDETVALSQANVLHARGITGVRRPTFGRRSRHNCEGVWLTLVAATFLSRWLATDEAHGGDLIAVVILVVAAVKIRLVGMHFMELNNAPRLLRGMFELYVAALLAGMVGFFLAA